MDKIKAKRIIDKLSVLFTDKPALNFTTPYELLIAVMLSAQCTDERVNKVTKELFKNYNTAEKMLTLSQKDLEGYIFSCGLYHSKAENILETSKILVEKYSSQVPNSLKELTTLPGVGKKTANVVYSVAFGGNAIAVDTHVFRVANRLGLVNETNVSNTEKSLMKILDEGDWSRAHHYLIYLGRSYCSARKPMCEECPVREECCKKLKR